MNTAVGYGVMGGQRMMGGAGLGAFGPIALLGFLLVGAVVIGLVIWLVVRKPSAPHVGTQSTPPLTSAEDTALAIARERLARGEIDPDQYTAIANALSAHSPYSTLNG